MLAKTKKKSTNQVSKSQAISRFNQSFNGKIQCYKSDSTFNDATASAFFYTLIPVSWEILSAKS